MEGRDAVRALSRLGGTAFKLKAGGITLLAFIVFLVAFGLFSGGMSGAAGADSCGKRGQPGVDQDDDAGDGTAGGNGPQTRKEQIENAKIIDKVAADGGLSGRATLIALMTALQESTLFNLDHGDLDSVGLFQQRPAAGWGTVEQIMQPTYSAKMFFFGADDGDPPGLDDVPGWETMDMGRAAQAVQRSAFPGLYAGHEGNARKIAREGGIDLDRPGRSVGTPKPSTGDDGANGGGDKGECYPGSDGQPGKPGDAFHDGQAPWPQEVRNPSAARRRSFAGWAWLDW
ncbi:hypothetical protein [Streptomyces sp. H27-H5]|uniref:hypothetical protein n=1 Tax=Streptomyces sp. H27-H5 TaxID=2996460 RepID=UPI00226DB5C8|nr:hypothetical protein [Streptomyces sp. H27-H5]MCY0963464.1 hypothetical protein [Streptomyces sp. H27-H5]